MGRKHLTLVCIEPKSLKTILYSAKVHSAYWCYITCHQETVSANPHQEDPTPPSSMDSPRQACYSPFYISSQHWLYLENIVLPTPCRLEHCAVLYWGTPTTLHYTVLRYTCNTALYCTEVHLQHCTVLYWGTLATLHCTVLRYSWNTALYCIEVHLQHCTVLYWGTPATLHYTVLRYNCNTALYCFFIYACNTALYCIKVHLQHCTVLFWDMHATLHCTVHFHCQTL